MILELQSENDASQKAKQQSNTNPLSPTSTPSKTTSNTKSIQDLQKRFEEVSTKSDMHGFESQNSNRQKMRAIFESNNCVVVHTLFNVLYVYIDSCSNSSFGMEMIFFYSTLSLARFFSRVKLIDKRNT